MWEVGGGAMASGAWGVKVWGIGGNPGSGTREGIEGWNGTCCGLIKERKTHTEKLMKN